MMMALFPCGFVANSERNPVLVLANLEGVCLGNFFLRERKILNSLGTS